jgi:hypothetical protein
MWEQTKFMVFRYCTVRANLVFATIPPLIEHQGITTIHPQKGQFQGQGPQR